jgi:hypothetical protein
MNRSFRFRRLWLPPLLLAVGTGGGLLSALLGDGVWNVFSWIALGLPAVTGFWILLRWDGPNR